MQITDISAITFILLTCLKLLVCLISITLLFWSDDWSLFKPGVVVLEESLESDAHVLIFKLLAKFVAEILDALFFELIIELFLLALAHTQHVVSVDLFGLLPEVTSLFQDMSSDKVDCLSVLHHQVAFVVLLVGRA